MTYGEKRVVSFFLPRSRFPKNYRDLEVRRGRAYERAVLVLMPNGQSVRRGPLHGVLGKGVPLVPDLKPMRGLAVLEAGDRLCAPARDLKTV
jgi:hypothetical protein